MIRAFSLSLAAILFLAPGSLALTLDADSLTSQEVPKAARIEIVLLNAPGSNNHQSNWEISYEFRIANDSMLWEAWQERKVKGGREQRVGDLIKNGVVKKNIRSPEDRKLTFEIPLSPEIRKRLSNQPRGSITPTSEKTTPANIMLSREQEMKSQSFQFYSVINIYDGKLKKTLVIPASFSWPVAKYPQAQFQIKVEINSDSSYSVNTTLPLKTH
jgi:hypothetical protein